MKMYLRNIHIVFWLGCLISIIVPSITYAAPLTATGSTNNIPAIVNSSGGSNNLTNSTVNYKLVDIKGQSVIGSSTGGTYGLGLGGIYGEVVAGGGGEGATLVDDAHIAANTLDIRRVGRNIVVEWIPTPSSWSTFYVFKSDNQYFSNTDLTRWDSGTTSDISTDGTKYYYTHYEQVGRGSGQVHYRVISINDKNQLVNKKAVGKVNLTCNPGFNLLCAPFTFEAPSNTLDFVFGNQMHYGTVDIADKIYIKHSSASWGMQETYLAADGRYYWSNEPSVLASSVKVDLAKGYLIQNRGTDSPVVTVAGKIASNTQAIRMTPGFNAIGTAFPVSKALNDLGLLGIANVSSGTVDIADNLYLKSNPASWGMENAYLAADGRWYLSNNPSVLATFTYNSPRGYYYRMKGSGEISWPRIVP